jgi:hypothetical protein
VEIGNFEPKSRLFQDQVHGIWHFLHSGPEVLAVLAGDVVGQDEIKNYCVEDGGQNNEIHVTITAHVVQSAPKKIRNSI